MQCRITVTQNCFKSHLIQVHKAEHTSISMQLNHQNTLVYTQISGSLLVQIPLLQFSPVNSRGPASIDVQTLISTQKATQVL